MNKRIKVLGIILIILIFIVSLKSVSAITGDTEKYMAKMYIDSIGNNGDLSVGSTIIGWAMSNDKEISFKAYIDEEEREIEEINREKREDVIEAIQGYGGINQNPIPGFKIKVNIDGISDGIHNLKVQINSRNGEILTEWKQTVNINKYEAKMYIDAPKKDDMINKMVNIEGWVMTNDQNSKIKIYIDNNEMQTLDIKREKREDVIKAIQGYGGKKKNPEPGFKCKATLEQLNIGIHEVTVKIFSRENKLLTEQTRIFKVEKYVSKLYVDSIGNDGILKLGTTIKGWAMSNDKEISFKAYIDEEEREIEEINREKRGDVIEAIQGYGGINQNPTPGFKIKVNIDGISDGIHNLKVQINSRNGEILTEWKQTVNINKYEAKMYIDAPKKDDMINKMVNIEGWVMTNDKESKIKVYIDDNEKQILNIKRETREDVIKAVNGYGGLEYNGKPGFNLQVNLEDDIKDGQHNLKVEIISRDGRVLTSDISVINLKKYDGRIYIDNPVQNERAKNNIYVRGWVMSEDKDYTIKVSIDNEQQKNIEIKKENREDVIKAISGYGGKDKNPQPGFITNIDTSNILDGNHELKIEILSRFGETIAILKRNVIVKKYETKICIDSPNTYYITDNSIYLRGWVMSELKNKQVVVKLDNRKIENINVESRPDVLEVIKNYGGKENNPTPGFNTQIDLSEYEKGEHIITIEIYSNEMNETIERIQIKVKNREEIKREVGSYGISGIWRKGEIRRK